MVTVKQTSGATHACQRDVCSDVPNLHSLQILCIVGFFTNSVKDKLPINQLSRFDGFELPYLEGLRVEQAVDGLRNVCGVDIVVVGHGAMVVVLEGQAEGDQGARVYLELAQQVTLLQEEGKMVTSTICQ